VTGTAGGTRLLVFDGAALVPADADVGADGADLAAADSWLVVDGRTRFLDAHHDRFMAACAGCDQLTTPAFWAAAMASLPGTGCWFPRVELTTTGMLRLRIRPAPEIGRELAVWLADGPDPRRHPKTKGPDLPALGRLRDRAVRAGANEALLTAPDGIVLEGTTTSLLWWEDDELCVPDPALPVLPGVTSSAIQRHAREAGITVRPVRAPVARLAGREVWLVNALHGIRPVVCWLGAGFAAGSAPRAARWQRWLGAPENLSPSPRPLTHVN
jgi:branched-subunit amino acid aminotransferase/4-amino-4-deoxychorismate lyase